MRSPFSSSLLNEPVDEAASVRRDAPFQDPRARYAARRVEVPEPERPGLGERVVARVRPEPIHRDTRHLDARPYPLVQQQHAQPQPYAYQPTPQPVVTRRGSSILPAVIGAILAIIVGIVALFGGYHAARAFAPSPEEFSISQSLSRNEAAFQARQTGIAAGRQDGFARGAETARLSSMVQSQRAWDKGYRAGNQLGRGSYRRPRPMWTGGGYTGGSRSYGRGWGGSSGGLGGALSSAQSLANSTGAPVDVEVY